jgi:hypothetical protein
MRSNTTHVPLVTTARHAKLPVVVVVKRSCLFCGVCVLACPGMGDFNRRRTRLKKGGGGPPWSCGCSGESGGARYYVCRGVGQVDGTRGRVCVISRENPWTRSSCRSPPPQRGSGSYMSLSLQIVGRSPKPVKELGARSQGRTQRGHVMSFIALKIRQ